MVEDIYPNLKISTCVVEQQALNATLPEIIRENITYCICVTAQVEKCEKRNEENIYHTAFCIITIWRL